MTTYLKLEITFKKKSFWINTVKIPWVIFTIFEMNNVYRPPVEPASGSSQPLAELHKETFRIFQASVFSVVCLLIFRER